MNNLSNSVTRKFTQVYDASEWLIETDTGWEEVSDVKETVEYRVWHLTLENGIQLKCADDHIVFKSDYSEVFVKDLKPGDTIITNTEDSIVKSIECTDEYENMYDIGVNSINHRYYTNNILSHNTTCAAGYLLWYSMFNPDQTILIAAHKFSGAQEIMQRIRYGYESCADFIRAGVVNYNKQSIEFENGSRIIAQTTTASTGRGLSISLLYCLDGDTTVTIRNKKTLIEETISLKDLFIRLNGISDTTRILT